MIILYQVKIFCASNFDYESANQKKNVENIKTLNPEINQNPYSTYFNHKFEKTSKPINNFSIEMILNTKDHCSQNFDLSGISTNFNNEDKIYAPELKFQTKINAANLQKYDYTKESENSFSFNKEHQSDSYNFWESIKQTSFNANIFSNSHDTLENHSIHNNSNQNLEENGCYQPVEIEKEYYESSKYIQNEEILHDQPLDLSTKKILQFDELDQNNDVSEIRRNSDFYEIVKPFEFIRELIDFEKEKSSLNITPPKRARINNGPFDTIKNLPNNFIKTIDVFTPKTETFNIKHEFQNPIASFKNVNKPITSNVINLKNEDKNENSAISQQRRINESQINSYSALSITTEQASNLLNNFLRSKTQSPSNNYEINSTRKIENNSPYDNDFDSPNFSLDFLNSYIADLNKNYSEKCENIFSIVVDKIFGVLIRLKYENKFNNLDRGKSSISYNCYSKINIAVGHILTEILDKNIPIYICTNNFININGANLDISKSKYAGYNIFRTKEQENDAFNSLISEIERKYSNEAKKMAKSAYKNFLEKLNPDILSLMDEINGSQNYNKMDLYSNINKVFIVINHFINFTNEQITETDSLIIYKVLKSISKFLRQTSEDSFLTSVFPEFRIINLLYHSRIEVHHISGRKFHAGIFLKKILKTRLKGFKDKYQNSGNIDNLDNTYFKEILEIRAFYILTFFKFLNIKKPYLLAYILLSIKSYLLKSEKNNYIEKNEFQKIFSLHVLNLYDILDTQVIIHLKTFIN
ncbi:hypothetical protein DMUE_2264 [Dictyocoela muelleri]|nr:hypothetical protein DMUE_2264 [Dictyocoela muelleri]